MIYIKKANYNMKYIPPFEEFVNENINELNSKEIKSLASLIGTGLDPESFYEYLRDYSEDEPDGEYGYSEDDLDIIIKAFDEIKQEALGMTRLNISQVKNSKLYKSYIKESLNESKYYIDKDNHEETISIEKKKDFITLYQENPYSGDNRSFVIASEQLPELIKILNKLK
jgi:hypothetical protein